MKQFRLNVLAGAGILFAAAPAMADPIELLLVGNANSVASTFGISPTIAFELAAAAGLTVAAQGPVSPASVPEPGALALAGLRRTRV